jgi:hypothetical protein
MFDAYTDYPIEGLDDTAGEKAPIRKCTILTWDRNKYCDVLVYFVDGDGDLRGYVTNFKQFYLYKNEANVALIEKDVMPFISTPDSQDELEMLKNQALALLDKAEDPRWDINDFSIVRKALEALYGKHT